MSVVGWEHAVYSLCFRAFYRLARGCSGQSASPDDERAKPIIHGTGRAGHLLPAVHCFRLRLQRVSCTHFLCAVSLSFS